MRYWRVTFAKELPSFTAIQSHFYTQTGLKLGLKANLYLQTIKSSPVELFTLLEKDAPEVTRLEEELLAINLANPQKDKKAQYQSFASKKAWRLALQHANILKQHLQMRTTYKKLHQQKATYSQLTSSRDSCMAANVKWILEHEGPDSKIVLWAHNAHISQGGYPGYWKNSMGSYLKKLYGQQVYAIGFDCFEGSYTGLGGSPRKLGKQELPPAEPGSFTHTVNQLGKPVVFVDFKQAREDKVLKDWFDAPHTIRYHARTTTGVLPDCFDAILFVSQTTASKPLYPLDK